jgi:hypothetical protein
MVDAINRLAAAQEKTAAAFEKRSAGEGGKKKGKRPKPDVKECDQITGTVAEVKPLTTKHGDDFLALGIDDGGSKPTKISAFDDFNDIPTLKKFLENAKDTNRQVTVFYESSKDGKYKNVVEVKLAAMPTGHRPETVPDEAPF